MIRSDTLSEGQHLIPQTSPSAPILRATYTVPGGVRLAALDLEALRAETGMQFDLVIRQLKEHGRMSISAACTYYTNHRGRDFLGQ